ncbi:ATP-dependent RNA helicase RhlE [Reichenbachiella faecimaris]|uniref:DEAD-box ATP-dependent RNA helicase RhpA n=1 Tax=Reichenbachiella faecimaris TaxID=692418 RepID=A0A1W2G7H5_REIFA|nr:DEAD/DEAH box helicase [Reichenbachiella faecimaris]SMD32246.1 ATP-dependent RNA helicase RhlE [Reichenbachiella faecimaris]
MTFEELPLIAPILKALKDKNYTEPTAIQAKAIPLVLDRNDVLGSAQTGTGKTAAFAIPIIQRIHEMEGGNGGKPQLLSLIVTPTRELAIQIDENIRLYSKYTNLKHTVIFGGVKQGSQVDKLKRGVHVLVATPGRLLDLISQGHISLNQIKIFVLDEADRMLDMGFVNDVKKLLTYLPKQRQSLFFSATMPTSILKLANEILTNPKKIEVNPVSSTAETIQQYLYYTNRESKKKLLLHILKDDKMDQVLIFGRTKHGADRIARDLHKYKIKSAAIHGDKAQNQRQKALKDFKAGKIRVLVATDIAARGIDIDKLKYVINYDVPGEAETYVHRIGRSGRAGEAGVAISISEPEENTNVKAIEKLTKQTIKVIKDHPFPQTEKPMTEAEKKEWNKEKQRRKQEFFANRKKSGGGRRR